MNRMVRSMLFVMLALSVYVGARETVGAFAQPLTLGQLETRVKTLESRLSAAIKPERLVWDADGSLDRDTSYAFAPGSTDTVSVMQVAFTKGRFAEPPVVTATARVTAAHGDWLGGEKDSFAVTIYNLTKDGCTVLLRRVDRSNKTITEGVMLDWIAVSRTPKG